MANVLADILTGANDERLLHELFMRIERPRNPAQSLFVQAWELSGFIASDGFENLFEQDRSLDEFAQLLTDIGFPEVLPIFQKVTALVPHAMRCQDSMVLRDHLRVDERVLANTVFPDSTGVAPTSGLVG